MHIQYDTSDTGRFLSDIRRLRGRLDGHQRNLASGQKLHGFEDDPAQASAALRLRALRSDVSALGDRQAQARGILEATDQALGQFSELLAQSRELTLQAQSPLTQGDSAEAIAHEVDSVRDSVLHLANTKFVDTFLFGGTRFGGRNEATPPPPTPFSEGAGGAVTYNGNQESIQVEVFPQSPITVNLPGSEVFQGAEDVFVVLSDLATAIRSHDGAGLDQSLTRLSRLTDQLAHAQSITGARLSRLDELQGDTADLQLRLAGASDSLEGADMLEEASGMLQDNTLLQAALSARARKSTANLFDFLG